MASHSNPRVEAEKIGITILIDEDVKQEPTYAEEYCEARFMELECVLGVDAIENEVLIDGRDVQHEESAGNINKHSDERGDVGNSSKPKKIMNKEKRRRRNMAFIKQAQFDDTAKRKRRKYEEEMMSSQLTVEDAKTDSENNSFKCGICHRTFSQKRNVYQHIVIHTGEKPYECEICHQRFNQKGHLNTHLITHTGEKPFKCGICNVEFSQKGNLNRHIKTHTGEKPFKCDVCNFECNQKVNLQKHVQRHIQKRLKTHNQLEELSDDMLMYVRNDEFFVAKLT